MNRRRGCGIIYYRLNYGPKTERKGGAGLRQKYLKNFTGRLVITAFFALIQIVTFIVTIMLSSYLIPINIALTVISILVVVLIVNQKKNPAFKLTWTLLILTFPVFGGLMYLAAAFQGSGFRFRRRMREAEAAVRGYAEQDPAALARLNDRSSDMASTARFLAGAGYPVSENTSAVYFPSGEEKFEWLKNELKRAEKFIFLEYFIIQEGIMWDSILKILIAKAKQGVEVRLIYDGMGSMSTLPPHYDRILTDLGIKVMVFNPFVPVATVIQNNRDHRKIVVVDGRTAFTGGINLADEYINAYERFGYWKDAGVMLTGDAVRSFTLIFLRTWYLKWPADPDIRRYLDADGADASRTGAGRIGWVQPYAGSPLDGESVGELAYFNLINKAKRYLYLMTPYLIPDHELLTALCFAARSGVDVRILTPHIPDKTYVFDVTRSFYGELLENGVRIYEYTPGFVHAKNLVCDDRTAVVGSINFDYRSLYLHFECAALLYDNPAVLDVKRDFLKAIEVSQEITPDVYREIRKKRGFFMSLLRLFAPLF